MTRERETGPEPCASAVAAKTHICIFLASLFDGFGIEEINLVAVGTDRYVAGQA